MVSLELNRSPNAGPAADALLATAGIGPVPPQVVRSSVDEHDHISDSLPSPHWSSDKGTRGLY